MSDTPAGPGAVPDGTGATIAVVYNPMKVASHKLRTTLRHVQQSQNAQQSQHTQTGQHHNSTQPALVFHETAPGGNGAQLARDALAAGATAVLAAGGDGTVRQVAEALSGSGIPLGILPFGTGNLLARNLEIPLIRQAAGAEIALTGQARPLDAAYLKLDDGERLLFTVVAGLGIDAAMIAQTPSALKRHFGWLAYIAGALRALRNANTFTISYRIDGGSWARARVSGVLVGNCGKLQGGIPLFPDAQPDDGLLDIALLQPNRFLDWVLVWRKFSFENRLLLSSSLGRRYIRFTRARDSRRVVTYLSGAHIELTLRAPQEFQVDGDTLGRASSATFEVSQGALLVRTPRAAAS